MSFKEDTRKNFILIVHFLVKKIDILLNRVEIHVIYEKSFKLKWIFEDTYENTLVICEIKLIIKVLI